MFVSVMMRRTTHQEETGMLSLGHSNNNSCFGTIFIKVDHFSLFLGGHTHNKTLSYRTIEGREDSGHYLAKEYNASCIYILYISLNVILRTETPMN